MPIQKKRKFKRMYKPVKLPAGTVLSYKNSQVLAQFITEQGAIVPKVENGLSQKLQRRLSREIKRARHLALLPFTQTL